MNIDSKGNITKEEAIKALIEIADDTVKVCKKDVLSKDGYATMMHLMGKFPEKSQELFLDVCVMRGYPKDTAEIIKKIMGWI